MKPYRKILRKLLRILCSALATVGTCAPGAALGSSVTHPDQGFTDMLPQRSPTLGTNYKDISEFLEAITLPKSIHPQVVKGDLNRDGNADTAVLLQSYPNGCEQLFILLQAPDGLLNLNNASKPVCGANLTSKVFIRNGSLFIYSEALKGEYGTMQFLYTNVGFELIGAKLNVAEGESDSTLRIVKTDINYRTGNATFQRMHDNQTLRTHATGPICLLSEFDFDFSYCADQWKTDEGGRLIDLMSPLPSDQEARLTPLQSPGRQEYNEERPKRILGGLTPAASAQQLAARATTMTPRLSS